MRLAPRLALVAAGLALAACAATPPADEPLPIPDDKLPAAPGSSPKPETRVTLDPSLVSFYARKEENLLSQGLLRQDGGGPDTPFDAESLTRSFLSVALFDEYSPGPDGGLVQGATISRLKRWEEPVRISLTFGGGVPIAVEIGDRAALEAYVERLSRVTGHQIEISDPERANFHVLVLGEDERRRAGPLIRRLLPRVSVSSLTAVTNLPIAVDCLTLSFSEPSAYLYHSALAVVRAEHPDLTRLACYHEELAQSLGLPGDSPDARPSIFNDDEEFALLTTHDELLLRILYDPRLRPGMTPDEAEPVVRVIVSELLGESGTT